MTGKNRRYNTHRKRLERWHNITVKLTEFEGLINAYDGASSAEVSVMKAIHMKLCECQKLALCQMKEVKSNGKM